MLFTPYSCDLQPFMPSDWRAELESAKAIVRRVRKEGGGPGSLSAGETAGLDYWAATRSPLIERLPWLDYIHMITLPALFRAKFDLQPRLLAITQEHGLTLNVLSNSTTQPGLEWHLDGEDVQLVAILPTAYWNLSTGGRLQTHDGVRVHDHDLTPGRALIVPSGDLPHAVEPVVRNGANQVDRLTVMFAYTSPERAVRESALSDYLFDPNGTP